MTPKRPKEFKWTGNFFPDGRPEKFLDFVPAADIGPEETDALSQDQIKTIRDSGLYREVEQPAPKKAGKAKSAPKMFDIGQPKAASEAEPVDTGDEPTTADTPATESEG